jgi:transposase
MMYSGIDLHSNNSVVAVVDDGDRVVAQKRLPNDIAKIVGFLARWQDKLAGVVVESTYNWYWLVDGLMEAGYTVHLANTAAIVQYEGLKYSADEHDARWLAHLLRLGILREGCIYPREARAVRHLMRRRMQLVQTRTTQLNSMQSQYMRSTAQRPSTNELKRMLPEDVDAHLHQPNVASGIRANLAVVHTLSGEIARLEREVLGQVRLAAQFESLLSIPGVGRILALAIMLETARSSASRA